MAGLADMEDVTANVNVNVGGCYQYAMQISRIPFRVLGICAVTLLHRVLTALSISIGVDPSLLTLPFVNHNNLSITGQQHTSRRGHTTTAFSFLNVACYVHRPPTKTLMLV